MTDQKIEEIRGRNAGGYMIANRVVWMREDLRVLLTELDRLKAELASERSLRQEDIDAGQKALRELYAARDEIATLKASGTFSDGVEAAAKCFDNVVRVDGVRAQEMIRSILTGEHKYPRDVPLPQSDAQAQREALAEFCYGKGYNDAQWHKDGKTATELVEAFEGSKA